MQIARKDARSRPTSPESAKTAIEPQSVVISRREKHGSDEWSWYKLRVTACNSAFMSLVARVDKSMAGDEIATTKPMMVFHAKDSLTLVDLRVEPEIPGSCAFAVFLTTTQGSSGKVAIVVVFCHGRVSTCIVVAPVKDHTC